MKIIFATKNAGKVKEVKLMLSELNAEILTMTEAGIDIDIDENGKTFEDNAIIKAKAVMEASGCVSISDDSGLEIDYIGKKPGVHSARFMGEETPYEVKNAKILEMLEGVDEKERTARFVSVIAAAFPDGKVITARGTVEGIIAYEPKGTNGFGYDPIFFYPPFEKTLSEIDVELKNSISHRGKALEAMKEKLKGLI
ncbi:RdgB/HAM1 family non-canonical purine NTP pyrophosphatase [Anaerotignum faecicola]|nr:RdgB/HAM1 family non-canonical purine NTP pyrophosphatase [Anaerotignum faecicola]